jgi:hypothetical protein
MIFEAETRKRVVGTERERERREPDSFSSTSNKSCHSLKRPPAFSATNFSHFIPLFCLFLTLTSASPTGLLYNVVGRQNIRCLSCAYAAWEPWAEAWAKAAFGPKSPQLGLLGLFNIWVLSVLFLSSALSSLLFGWPWLAATLRMVEMIRGSGRDRRAQRESKLRIVFLQTEN